MFKKKITAPFIHIRPDSEAMMAYVLLVLFVPVCIYSAMHQPMFIIQYMLYMLIGFAMDALYRLLQDGRLRAPSLSTGVTTGLLVLSIPTTVPLQYVVYALIIAVVLCKLMADKTALRLNPMLVGRLFLMVAYPAYLTGWTRVGVDLDAVTTATPIELFQAEGYMVKLSMILSGAIEGDWEGMYILVPGAPGEIMPLVNLAIGVFLYWRGVLDWRCGTFFVLAHAATCAVIGLPVLFNVLSGSVIFSAVYIAGDLRSTPGSRFGRIAGGVVAGVINACVRKYTYWPEGVAYSFLIVNLLSPTLDRIAFHVRGWRLVSAGRG